MDNREQIKYLNTLIEEIRKEYKDWCKVTDEEIDNNYYSAYEKYMNKITKAETLAKEIEINIDLSKYYIYF